MTSKRAHLEMHLFFTIRQLHPMTCSIRVPACAASAANPVAYLDTAFTETVTLDAGALIDPNLQS